MEFIQLKLKKKKFEIGLEPLESNAWAKIKKYQHNLVLDYVDLYFYKLKEDIVYLFQVISKEKILG